MKKSRLSSSALTWGITSIAALTSLGSCSDQRLASTGATSKEKINIEATASGSSSITTSYTKTVGTPIDQPTGRRWIQNFISTKPTTEKEFYLPANSLKSILLNNTCVGINLFYATDYAGRLVVIPIGMDSRGNVIPTSSISLQNTICDWQTAWAWINKNTGKVKSHFFGADTFKRLLVDQNSPSIRLSIALNDTGNPQLLLSNAAQAEPTLYQDHSMACPPVCPSLNQ